MSKVRGIALHVSHYEMEDDRGKQVKGNTLWAILGGRSAGDQEAGFKPIKYSVDDATHARLLSAVPCSVDMTFVERVGGNNKISLVLDAVEVVGPVMFSSAKAAA